MVKTVRRIAADLRPGVLDNLGLAASLGGGAEFRRRTGIICGRAPEQKHPITQPNALRSFALPGGINRRGAPCWAQQSLNCFHRQGRDLADRR
jgi:hypothetical protein